MAKNQPNQRLLDLAKKWLEGTIAREEKTEFELWYNSFDDTSHEKTAQESIDELELKMQQQIFAKAGIEQSKEIKTISLWPRIAAAAAIIFITSVSLFYYVKNNKTDQDSQVVNQAILPGGNKAFLTLSNGKMISLTNAANGSIAKQGVATITKTANGKLIYSILNTNHSDHEELQYNTVETPKGGQYQIQLPDGSKVWLNAASSLKYPVSFAAQKDRKVKLTGEAYFEVAKDKSHPFIVESTKQDVKVLGTHFNVNAYADEPDTKTTLLEGSIRLNDNTILKPGEQATLIQTGKITVQQTDVDDAVAWKNGKFVFASEDLKSIMRKLSRWYNVDVVYDGDLSARPFTGSISRYDNIFKILDKITFIEDIHFKIEGRRVTVMK